jgi:hypothetical protein
MRTSLFCLFIILFSSCSEQWKADVRKLNVKEINEVYNDWELVDYSKLDSFDRYRVSKIHGDTVKILDFAVSDSYSDIYAYTKEFPCGDADTCVLYIDPPNDTIYYYKGSNGHNYFYSGEYNFRFEYLLFDKNEFNFYLFFEDSLSKVKGNGLPNLPTLTSLQQSKLDSILRRDD